MRLIVPSDTNSSLFLCLKIIKMCRNISLLELAQQCLVKTLRSSERVCRLQVDDKYMDVSSVLWIRDNYLTVSGHGKSLYPTDRTIFFHTSLFCELLCNSHVFLYFKKVYLSVITVPCLPLLRFISSTPHFSILRVA